MRVQTTPSLGKRKNKPTCLLYQSFQELKSWGFEGAFRWYLIRELFHFEGFQQCKISQITYWFSCFRVWSPYWKCCFRVWPPYWKCLSTTPFVVTWTHTNVYPSYKDPQGPNCVHLCSYVQFKFVLFPQIFFITVLIVAFVNGNTERLKILGKVCRLNLVNTFSFLPNINKPGIWHSLVPWPSPKTTHQHRELLLNWQIGPKEWNL